MNVQLQILYEYAFLQIDVKTFKLRIFASLQTNNTIL